MRNCKRSQRIGNWKSRRQPDPTPEQIAERRAGIPAGTHRSAGPGNPEDYAHAAFYRWLFDSQDVTPLRQAVPEGK